MIKLTTTQGYKLLLKPKSITAVIGGSTSRVVAGVNSWLVKESFEEIELLILRATVGGAINHDLINSD